MNFMASQAWPPMPGGMSDVWESLRGNPSLALLPQTVASVSVWQPAVSSCQFLTLMGAGERIPWADLAPQRLI